MDAGTITLIAIFLGLVIVFRVFPAILRSAWQLGMVAAGAWIAAKIFKTNSVPKPPVDPVTEIAASQEEGTK